MGSNSLQHVKQQQHRMPQGSSLDALVPSSTSNASDTTQRLSLLLAPPFQPQHMPLQHHQHLSNDTLRKRLFSSTSPNHTDEPSPSVHPTKFAVVDHSEAYEQAMQGRHGQQLALARLEGLGKDDPPFDPFLDQEEKLLAVHDFDDEGGDDDDDDDADIVEAEIVSSTSRDGDEKSNDSGYEEDDEDEEDYDDDKEEDEDDYDAAMESMYNPDGSVRRKKSVLATLRAGYPAGGLFAVVDLAGAQYKVTTDDLLVVSKLKPVEQYKVGSVHTFKDNIMLAGSSHLTLVGMPYVPGAEVDVMVEEITQDAKVIIFKKRRRKHSQRKNGYRRDLTLLRILDVRLPKDCANHIHVGRDSVDQLLDESSMVGVGGHGDTIMDAEVSQPASAA